MTKIFDPFNDRTSRDIRNELSSALVVDLTAERPQIVAQVARHWLQKAVDTAYQSYIQACQYRYDQVIGQIKAQRIDDTRHQAVVLWNSELFFEMHELLETVWHPSQGDERIALKGLIQAAGAYVHLRRNKPVAAQTLALRACKNMRKAPSCLKFIGNLDELLTALDAPISPPPKLWSPKMA